MPNKFKIGWLGGKTKLNITSPFGNRSHPINHTVRMHYGIDIGIPQGTPIYAPYNGVWGGYSVQTKNGKVTGAGLYGWMVYTDEKGDKYQIIFMHLSRKSTVQLTPGLKISVGTCLGFTGGAKGDKYAGSSTGPHLHLEVHKNVGNGINYTSSSHAINPISFLSEELSGSTGGKINNVSSVSTDYTSSGVIIPNDDIDNSATEWDEAKEEKKKENEQYVDGIWQIVKVLIDDGVKDKKVYDSSISTMTGPLINFFNKVCQKPMVEFFGDTIGSQYYFFARRPPFDSNGIRKSKVICDIDFDDVIKFSMTKNNNNIYSWYQFIPQAELLVSPQLQQYVPAVFFKEYADIWGSRPLSVQSNYYNYSRSGKKEGDKKNTDNIIKNALLDFRYIIESNAYNPFIWNANVSLFGIKHIKIGTFVTFNNKKFYVESVNHNIDCNGNMSTELSLSHGMELKFIDEYVLPNGDKISYFNLIDFGDFDKKINNVKFSDWKDLLSDWKVDYDNFGFFLRQTENASGILHESEDGINIFEDITYEK